MEVTFGKGSVPATAVDNTPTPTSTVAPKPTLAEIMSPAPAPTATGPVGHLVPAVQKAQPVGKADNFLLGDFLPSFKDIILPRLAISQNIGSLKETFISGTVVFDRRVALFVPPAIKDGKVVRDATPTVSIIVVGFRPTRFVEKVAGSAERGQIVPTERAVALAGGTLDWTEWRLKKEQGMKLFQPLADALLVIERPESEKENLADFTYEVDGRFYALALWAMKGTAYTAAAKRVFFTSRRIGLLRTGGYPSWSYTMATREDTFPGGNKAWTPVCLPKEKTSQPLLEFIQSVLNAPAAEATEEEAAAAAASAE